jgi:hypothetical protein
MRSITVVCVQPQDPVTGPVPQPPPASGPHPAPTEAPPPATTPTDDAAPTPKPKKRNTRLWVAMIGGILALLCLGGVGVAVLLYDKETKVDRAEPDAVVDNFVRAYVVDKNDNEVALYQCKTAADLGALSALRTEILDREKNFKVHVSVSWSTLTVNAVSQAQKNVNADLTIAGSSGGKVISRRTESWSFTVLDQDGWRVCGATKVSP